MTFFSLTLKGQKKVTYGLILEPGYGFINVKTPNCINLSLKGSIYYKTGISTSFYFSKKVSIQSGIALFKSSFNFHADEYNVQFNALDSEQKRYLRIISGTNISENTCLYGLNLPLNYVQEFPINRNMRFYAAIGPSFLIPIQINSKVNGIFTYRGHYSDGNYTLENIPIYGFDSDVEVNREEKENASILVINGSVVIGFNSNITRYLQFFVQGSYSQNFTGYTRNASDDYVISNQIGSFYSLLRNKAILSNFCLGIGFQKILYF